MSQLSAEMFLWWCEMAEYCSQVEPEGGDVGRPNVNVSCQQYKPPHSVVRSVRTLGLEWAQHSPLVVRPSPDLSTNNPDATDSEGAALPQ